MDQEYSGWTNYPTWNVKLWIDNEETSYHSWRRQTAEAWEHAEPTDNWTRRQSATYKLADELKETHQVGSVGAGYLSDCLGWALSCVNWDEIAKSMIEDYLEGTETTIVAIGDEGGA